MPAQLSDTDFELLSAYVDGMLPAAEAARLEQRLAQEPALAQELRALRALVDTLRHLPDVKAPRNFTLTPAMVPPPIQVVPPPRAAPPKVLPAAAAAPARPRPRALWLPAIGTAAAVFVALFGFFALLSQLTPAPVPTGDGVAVAATATPTAQPFSNMVMGNTAAGPQSVPATTDTALATATATAVPTLALELAPAQDLPPAGSLETAPITGTGSDGTGGMGDADGAGTFSGEEGRGGDPSIDAAMGAVLPIINPDVNQPGFSLATMMPAATLAAAVNSGDIIGGTVAVAQAATAAPAALTTTAKAPAVPDQLITLLLRLLVEAGRVLPLQAAP